MNKGLVQNIQWDMEGHIVARSSEEPQGKEPHLCTIRSILTFPLLALPTHTHTHKALGSVLGKVK